MKRYDMEREPKMHDLKTDSEVFQAVISGLKTFEIRFNDRDFKVGDRLHLLETVSTGEEMAAGAVLEYTGGDCIVVIKHILHGPIYGLKDGWVIMSIEHEASDFYPEHDLQAWALKLKEVVEGMGHSQDCPCHSHGCTVDLEEGQEPDHCVIDEGKPHLCVYAKSITAKEECRYWKPDGECRCPRGEALRLIEETCK